MELFYPFLEGSNLMQTYANLKVFPLQQPIVWAGNIIWPLLGDFFQWPDDQMKKNPTEGRWWRNEMPCVGVDSACVGGKGEGKLTTTPPPTTNQRWRISWWFQGCICSFLRKNEMMRYFCLDFWWNVGDGGKLVSTVWNKFSPCCSHLMIETYCCSYKWTANFQERISTGQQLSQWFWRLMEILCPD